MPHTVIPTPTVTFSTLAKLMGSNTSTSIVNLLRGHKYPTDGPRRSYQNARRQVVEHLVSGSQISTSGLRSHEIEAVTGFVANDLSLPTNSRATRPSTQNPRWQFGGVEISVLPDVLLNNPTHSGAVCGGIKIHFNKEPLARGVGPSMAALLHYYLAHVLEVSTVTPGMCYVYEARSGAVHSCGSPTRLLSSAQNTCTLIAALWPTL
jgi:hypothetical protein